MSEEVLPRPPLPEGTEPLPGDTGAPEQQSSSFEQPAPAAPAGPPVSPPQTTPVISDEEVSRLHEQLVPMEHQQRLEELTRVSFEEGLEKAVRAAKKLADPFLIDELHDRLANELKSRLIAEGKLEEL